MSAQAEPGMVLVSLDQHIGQLRLPHAQAGAAPVGIDLYPAVLDTLRQLDRRGVRIVLLARTGEDEAREWQPFAGRPLLVVHHGRDLAAALQLIGQRLPAPVQGALFVSADRKLRSAAQSLGLRPGPHIAWAPWALDGCETVLVRLTGPRERFERLHTCLPYRLVIGNGPHATLLAVMTRQGLADAVALRLDAQVLPFDPAREDVLLVRLDDAPAACQALGQARVLLAHDKMALLALGPDEEEDALGLHGAHGHFELLAPNIDLLRPAGPPAGTAQLAARLSRWSVKDLTVKPIDVATSPIDLGLWSCPGNAAAIENDVRRYSGMADPGGGPLRSRHTRHPDNARAVDLLVADLTAMGYCAHVHAFDHDGRTLHNVVADLPGAGIARVFPDLRALLRDILVRMPPWPPQPDPPWRKEALALLGQAGVAGSWSHLQPEEFRLRLERRFDLQPWLPWWLPCPLAGYGAGLVVVGCHLDSTAGFDAEYDPRTGAAPGVDDDASGIAATLAIARSVASREGALRHTIRFCFFNGEEQGLAGSRAYAAHLKALNAPVRAVICSDMIGFNSDANGIFEIHAGYSDPAVRDLSLPVAERIRSWADTLGAPGLAQIYRGTSAGGGTDRNLTDGAIGRSDHASFHEQGYPAVVVSEDFFANLPSEPAADPNPNYHRAADTVIDYEYAANIACVIAETVKELAQ